MKTGDCVTFFRRGHLGQIIGADFVVIIALYAACAIVRYAGETQNAHFKVMTTDLKA